MLEFSFSPSGDEIVAVGRLVKEKDFGNLITAFSELVKVHSNLTLRLIGDGPEKLYLEGLVSQLELGDKVIFHGFSPNPIPYMKGACACVVSSKIEGFPNTLLEMMAVGRRVVSTECADGIRSLPGVVTCKTESSDELCAAILCSLKQSKRDFLSSVRAMRKYTNSIDAEAYVKELFFDEK
ncbi:glycosyltransferase [Pseudoalteromonas sp. T1lg22]|uniref:glycosyltransferase n=1 Tax=Pseudoalteromonas sp. T1lg22 TaxID=2077096 RepID=UPI001F2E68E6|nr:glycosyltransferase [Pseudoalteromonas sp. T1lg22]